MAYKASCLCGEIEIESRLEPIFSTFHHCKVCGIFFDKAVFPPGTVLHISSDPVQNSLDSIEDSEHYLCSVCGSTLKISKHDEMVRRRLFYLLIL
jgi:hypothetical protein